MHLLYVQLHNRAPRRHEIPKPADHFDLIIGTGTGGLIAIMLGRLRLDLETCKEVYVRMTRRVFESDKTIAGVPYRKTLFKASKLEEAIRQCVREHTVDQAEGNDDPELEARVLRELEELESEREGYESAKSPVERLRMDGGGVRRHQSNASIVSFSARGLPPSSAGGDSYRSGASNRGWSSRFGDSNAKLYDRRENRTKT